MQEQKRLAIHLVFLLTILLTSLLQLSPPEVLHQAVRVTETMTQGWCPGLIFHSGIGSTRFYITWACRLCRPTTLRSEARRLTWWKTGRVLVNVEHRLLNSPIQP